MNSMNDHPWRGRSPVSLMGTVVRVGAVVDAIGLPAALLFWVWALPQRHGGFVGATLAAVLVLWAVKRATRAIFDLENYRWFSRWLVRFGAIGVMV